MIDLRTYKSLIQEVLTEANNEDKNWKFRLRHLSSKKCSIRWSYLNYIGEEDDFFSIEADLDDEDDSCLFVYTPQREIIECFLVTEGNASDRHIGALVNIKSGLRMALEEINYYAHSRY